MKLTVFVICLALAGWISIQKFIFFSSRYKHKLPATKTTVIYFPFQIVRVYTQYTYVFQKNVESICHIWSITYGNLTEYITQVIQKLYNFRFYNR